MEPGVEVVIVHHRTPGPLRDTLARLAAHAAAAPVTVVDTAMDAAVVADLASAHPHLTWHAAPNHSYAHAVNTGLKSTTAPLVVVMNADVLIGPDTIADLCAACDDPRVALAGPVARTPAGRVQDQGLPYRLHHARLRWRTRWAAGRRPPASVPVPWLSGCLLLVRRAAIDRIGGMDARLRFYNEDLEWGLRARAAGWRCALVATDVIHLGGAATPSDGRFLVEGLRGGYTLTRRHAGPLVRWAHRWLVAGAAALAALLARDPQRRSAWRDAARRFARGDLDDAPFGDTLSDGLSPPRRGPAGR
ncbi:MAG: glycosyltransferase [Trueperaceae bacterium]|nr:glycosyltransferase [Trueperaceae bacterium]